ncbi:MAG: IS110 family transposase [Bacteroidota bacterium]|nr:IS110 family transposase [Bacteroidota bacterium]
MPKLDQINQNAAAFDVGSEKVFLAMPDSKVFSFLTFTPDLKRAVEFLIENEIPTVAMESTGVYGIVLYEMLVEAGIEVCLVNPSHVKMVPGRKTDVQDCQWLQQLHSYGLLRSSFIPDAAIKELRSYVRLRENHIEEQSSWIQRMQKALTMMNIRLHQVISQIHGVSGMKVVKAILKGERDAETLLQLCDQRIINHKREEVLKSLNGNYKEEHLFALQQAVEYYEFIQSKIVECDAKIGSQLFKLNNGKTTIANINPPKKIRHHKPEIENYHEKMVTLVGKDITSLPGITDYNLLQVVSETGTDLTKWPNENHFTSWLGLSPGKNNSGKMTKKVKKKASPRAGLIFREAAQTLLQSKNITLGHFARRLRARKGPYIAIMATARKLAELFYRAMTKGLEYVEKGIEVYQKQLEMQQLKSLIKRAALLNMTIVPNNLQHET